MKILINNFIPGEETELSELIKVVYDEFVAPDYTSEGNVFFYDYIQPEKILERFLGKNEIVLTAKCDNIIIGVLDVKNKSHISLLFVAKNFQGKGVSSMLMNEYLKRIASLAIDKITVHASPYSVKIYEKLGFSAVSDMLEENGIRYLPMTRLVKK
jgi:predicted GNAT family N-acyltransferase